MRRTIVAAIAAGLLLAGCSSEQDGPRDDDTTSAEASPAAPSPEAEGTALGEKTAQALGYTDYAEWSADAASTYPDFQGVRSFNDGVLVIVVEPPADREPAPWGKLAATSVVLQHGLAKIGGDTVPLDQVVVQDPDGMTLTRYDNPSP